MNRLLALAPALLLALPAIAQDAPAAPEAGYKSLWCHLAFVTTSTQIPPLPAADLEAARAAGDAATPEQLELLTVDTQIKQIVDGIPLLLEAATASYTEAGYTPEQFETARSALEVTVAGQISGVGDAPEFAFEDCLAAATPTETTTQ